MYTPIIAPADLKTKIYPEIQALITRGDADIQLEAIDTAIAEVKMYLSKYDLVQMFGSSVQNVSATFSDSYLSSLVKTVAVWNILRLANPNIQMSVAFTSYEQAISSLKKIQTGMAQPDGWPYKNTIGETAPQGDSIYSNSNPQKRNHF
jgi:hypothetical protein